MTTKTICDLCGKEKEADVKRYTLREETDDSSVLDICEECYKRILHLKTK